MKLQIFPFAFRKGMNLTLNPSAMSKNKLGKIGFVSLVKAIRF